MSAGSLCIYRITPLHRDGERAKQSEAAGLVILRCWMRRGRTRGRGTLHCLSSRIVRGRAHHLPTQRLGTGTRELGSPAQQELGYARLFSSFLPFSNHLPSRSSDLGMVRNRHSLTNSMRRNLMIFRDLLHRGLVRQQPSYVSASHPKEYMSSMAATSANISD